MKADRRQIQRIIDVKGNAIPEEFFIYQLEYQETMGNQINHYQAFTFKSDKPVELYLQHPISERVFLISVPEKRRILIPMMFPYSIKSPNLQLTTLVYGFTPAFIPYMAHSHKLPKSLEQIFNQSPKSQKGQIIPRTNI